MTTPTNNPCIDLDDYQLIARLIGIIFFAGDFKAETANERQLEALLIKTGHRYRSWAEIDALLDARQVAPVAPTGYKLVPLKCTPEMRAAWDKAPQHEDGDVEFFNAYHAMIEAAPATQQAGAPDVPAHYRKVLAMPDGPDVVSPPPKVCRVCGSLRGTLHALNCTHGTSTVIERDCRTPAATTASASDWAEKMLSHPRIGAALLGDEAAPDEPQCWSDLVPCAKCG